MLSILKMSLFSTIAFLLCLAWLEPRTTVAAPCCSPKQWASEIRTITMTTSISGFSEKQGWYWASYDYDQKRVAVIIFDFWRPDVYQRQLLDFAKGVRYVTPDEFRCTAQRLKGQLLRMCVPPPGDNVTADASMHFGVYNNPQQAVITRTVGKESSAMAPGVHVTQTGKTRSTDFHGVNAETIYFHGSDVSGYVTVTSPYCVFVNEMVLATLTDGTVLWRHTQWNNVTLTVDPESFNMPSSCNITDIKPEQEWEKLQSDVPGVFGALEKLGLYGPEF